MFDIALLQAVSDWQRGGDQKQNARRGAELKRVCAQLPKQYRFCESCCFRQVALPKGGVWSLIGQDCLSEKISSWTLDAEVAKAFKGGVPPKDNCYQGVILRITPQPCDVVVNLHILYQDDAFIAAMNEHARAIKGYPDGAGRYGNNQCEVVLEISSVTPENIYSLGGHSSCRDDIIKQYVDSKLGHTATQTERDALLLNSESLSFETGPKWLSPEATQRVLIKTQKKWTASR